MAEVLSTPARAAGEPAMATASPAAAVAAELRLRLAEREPRAEAWDLWQLLRHVDALCPQLPRLGEAPRPQDEAVRLAQPADMTFAPTTVAGIKHPCDADKVPDRALRVEQRVFGLLGPNGPLPLHLTELARDRAQHHGDATLQAFVDMLGHRFALLFYRAWAQAQPVVHLDRPEPSPLQAWIGALYGVGEPSLMGRDALGDAPKLHFAGRLGRDVRDADGLQAWCRAQFGVPLQLQQWVGHWMALERGERTRLSRRDAQGLGRGAVIGERVWDVQHKFRLVIGPLSLPRFLSFLPGGRDLARLRAMVRQWVGLEFEWDVRLILRRAEVPELRLGAHDPRRGARTGALGRSAWLGRYRGERDADALVIDVERTLHAGRAGAAPDLPDPDTPPVAPATGPDLPTRSSPSSTECFP